MDSINMDEKVKKVVEDIRKVREQESTQKYLNRSLQNASETTDYELWRKGIHEVLEYNKETFANFGGSDEK